MEVGTTKKATEPPIEIKEAESYFTDGTREGLGSVIKYEKRVTKKKEFEMDPKGSSARRGKETRKQRLAEYEKEWVAFGKGETGTCPMWANLGLMGKIESPAGWSDGLDLSV